MRGVGQPYGKGDGLAVLQLDWRSLLELPEDEPARLESPQGERVVKALQSREVPEEQGEAVVQE